MVAYSFKKRFAELIVTGAKRQTIRAPRKRHARVGEDLQLYTAMRTKQCRLLALAKCTHVLPIRIDLAAGVISLPTQIYNCPVSRDLFAVSDGFADFEDMRAFWNAEHPDAPRFEGVLIRWMAPNG